jgi:hypothetical protein
VRATDRGGDLARLLGLTRNGSYKLYLNSSRERRGVGIAIRRNIAQEIINIHRDAATENFIILDLNLKGKK